jgi:hypothetical protein
MGWIDAHNSEKAERIRTLRNSPNRLNLKQSVYRPPEEGGTLHSLCDDSRLYEDAYHTCSKRKIYDALRTFLKERGMSEQEIHDYIVNL